MIRKVILGVILSFSSIALILVFSGVKDFYKVILLDPIGLSFSMGFGLFLLVIDAVRLNITLMLLGYRLSFGRCFENIMICSFFSLITPFNLGGQPLQIYDLSNADVPGFEATNVIVTRTLITMFASLTAGLVFMPHVMSKTVLGGMKFPVILGYSVSAVSAILISIAFFNAHLAEKILKLLLFPFSRKVKAKVMKTFNEQVEEFKKSVRNLWGKRREILFVDAFIWAFYMLLQPLSLYIPLKFHCGFTMSYWTLVGTYIILNITAFFIPTPGASGGVESVFYLALAAFAPADCLLKSIILWRISVYYFPLFLGSFFAWRLGYKEGRIK